MGRSGRSAAFFFCLLCGYYLLRPVRESMGLRGGVLLRNEQGANQRCGDQGSSHCGLLGDVGVLGTEAPLLLT